MNNNFLSNSSVDNNYQYQLSDAINKNMNNPQNNKKIFKGNIREKRDDVLDSIRDELNSALDKN